MIEFRLFKNGNGVMLTLFLMFASCVPESEKLSKLDKYLTKKYEKGQLNGNVLISKKGKILYQKSFGISKIDPIDSLEPNSVFRLASVSKQFTAMGVMILKEQGKLTYGQNIKDFIPGLPYDGITIRHLLNHTSGLPDYIDFMEKNWKPQYAVYDRRRFIAGNGDIIHMLMTKKPEVDFAPGEKWKYCNTGYMLLATIIARASGISYERYLEEQIFEPAGMRNTIVYKYFPGRDPKMPLRVYGYLTERESSERYTMDCHFLNRARGDGGIYSTAGDLLKWDQVLYTEKLVSNEILEEAFTAGKLNDGSLTNYGFGWFLEESPKSGKVVEHKGGWCGFRTCIYREIEKNNCIIILTNNSGDYLPQVLSKLQRFVHRSG